MNNEKLDEIIHSHILPLVHTLHSYSVLARDEKFSFERKAVSKIFQRAAIKAQKAIDNIREMADGQNSE